MKILHRQVVNNLLVGLIPLFLILAIIFAINKSQAEKNSHKVLSTVVNDFKIILESDLSKYRDFAYFVGRASEDYITGSRQVTSNLPINIESFDFRMYEVYVQNKLKYQDIYSWSDSIYFAKPERVQYIWDFLKSGNHSIFFKISFPEIVSNVLVLRNCAIMTRREFERIGYVSVISPLDSAYLSRMPFVNQDVILFIQTSNGIRMSDETMQKPEIIADLMKTPLGQSGKYNIKKYKNTGKYYYYKENLYAERVKVGNRFQQNYIADVGVIYNYNVINKDFFLYRRIIFIILIISLLAFPLISLVSGRRISAPIYQLKKQVDHFKKDFKAVQPPERITDEISMLQQSFHEMSRAMIEKSEDLTVALTELALANEDLSALTVEDGLTGVKNRRYFNNKIESEIKRATRLNETLSLLMIDLDHFKKVNDTYGHEAGDMCLKQAAQIMKKHAIRSGDAVTRYGGEEFCLILPNTDVKGARIVAEKIRKEMEATPVIYKNDTIRITLSVGVAGSTAKAGKESLENITSHADAALYRAKDTGRNKVVVYKKPKTKDS